MSFKIIKTSFAESNYSPKVKNQYFQPKLYALQINTQPGKLKIGSAVKQTVQSRTKQEIGQTYAEYKILSE
jgi:exopolysaccharide biosynthesis protein